MVWNPDLVPHSRMVRALPMEPCPQTLSIALYDFSCQEVRWDKQKPVSWLHAFAIAYNHHQHYHIIITTNVVVTEPGFTQPN